MVRHGRIIFLVIAAMMLLVGGASAYLAGYGYYQDATVNNTGSNLTNYQVMFVVNTSSGTSSGTTLYLNSHSEADLDDLRFTATDDTVYDYWIESVSSPYNVWVEVPSIPIGNTTVRVQYGNAAASAYSNGTNTFPFYDNFLGAALDTTTKWTIVQNNGLSVGSGLLTISSGAGNYGEIRTKSSYGPDVILMFNVSVATYYTGFGFGDANNSGTGSSIGLVKYSGYESAIFTGAINADNNWCPPRSYASSSTSGDIITDPTVGVYYIEDFAVPNGTKIKEQRNRGGWTTSTRYDGITTNKPLNIFHYRENAAFYLDWILIRVYAATEPTVPAWSSEASTSAAPVAAFSANRTTGAPGNVSFTDASTNTPTSWAWSFDDGTPNSTDQNPIHTFSSAGTYTITLTATNLAGSDIEEKIDYITLTDAPVAAFHANTTSGYVPLSVLFTDDSTNTPTSWAWSWGDATANGTTQNPNHTYTTAGTFNVTLTATNAGGSDSETKLAYITTVALVAFPGCAAVPTDLDADGLYEDVNGNTRKDWADIILFFKYRIWAAANEPAAAFDWNSNGIIDYKDVLMLYDEGV